MAERGIDKPGWLLRQMDDVQRESKHWPERMKRALREKQEHPIDSAPVRDAAYNEHEYWPRGF